MKESDLSAAPEDSGVMDSSSSEDQRLILYDTGNPSVSTLTEKVMTDLLINFMLISTDNTHTLLPTLQFDQF